jgi:acyl-CoA dehydrogenase
VDHPNDEDTMTTTIAAPAPVTTTTDSRWAGVDPDSRWPTTARRLVPRLAAQAGSHDRTGAFVQGQVDLLREHGLAAMLVPAELGGGGASFAEAGAVLAELAHGCPATSLVLSMHTHLVAAQVWRYRRDLPAPILAKVAAGQLLVSTGASDWLESNGSATRVDGGFRVSARKQPASGAPAGDVVITSVRWADAPDGAQVIHCAIPFSAAGVTVDETWDAMGMRGTGSHTVVLEDVFVPDEAVALVRPAGVWHPVWSTVLGVALPLIMATYVGVAEAAAGRVLDGARSRADRPDTAPLVGRMLNRLTTARDTVRAMIDAAEDLRFDNSIDVAALSLSRKSIAAEACLDTVRVALEIAGGTAYSRSDTIERLFRDVHGALFHPMPTARQERFTGRIALGLDPVV